MLRRRLTWGFVLAGALCVAAPSFTQIPNLSQKLDEAEKELDADIKSCTRIYRANYLGLYWQAQRNTKMGLKMQKDGVPVDLERLRKEEDRAAKLADRAVDASDAQNCHPEQPLQPVRAQKPAAPPPLVQPGVTQVKDPFKQLEDDADDALDDLDDAMDDCDEAAVKALIPELEQLAKQAHDVADTAKAAGALSRIDAKEAATLASDLDKGIAAAKKFKCTGKKTSYFRYTPIELAPFQERLLAIHNEERSGVHARPLKWNFELEWHAIGYADHLSQSGGLEHAPREGRGIERENLLQTEIGWGPDRMMQEWIGEKRYFHPGFFPDVCAGEWTRCAHYTQIIWPTTTDFGCGYAEGGGYGWLVCRYSPGGNKDGKPVGIAYPMPERG
jgi:hypothetical protein